MSEVKLIYLGESGSHYILALVDTDEGFIGIAELRKCRIDWANKYYYDDQNRADGALTKGEGT